MESTMKLSHTVTLSIAPILCILDDHAGPLQLLAFPLSLAFWLPCWLYTLASRLLWHLPRIPAGIRMYISGWRDDLRLMASAVNEAWRVWGGCKAWAVGAG